MTRPGRGSLLAFVVLTSALAGAHPASAARPGLAGTVQQLLDAGQVFAIGHRGSGENQGEDPSRPIENTVPGVRTAFRAGVSVVEVDVQLTRDGAVAVFHEDFLPDFTCLNTLTLDELQARVPHVPSLNAVLNQAKQFNDPGSAGGLPRGLVIVEMKAASPLCDPEDLQERAMVSAVVRVIRQRGVAEQVLLASLSPALLFLAADEAPDIARVLTVSGLQLLSPDEVEALLGLPVTVIDKGLDLGLQWAEIGPLFRLPGYGSVAELIGTAFVTAARVVEADLFLLASAGPALVDALHGLGLTLFGFTAGDAATWCFMQSLGVDAIYTDDVPLGVALQAGGCPAPGP
jgi:glycerophosphoryl diester phosphodiesterase